MREYGSIIAKGALLAAALILAACANPFGDNAPSFEEILSAGWLGAEDKRVPVDPVYCYVTIGAPDCHAEPLAGEGGRLRGYEGPAPVVRVEN
ncbi:MAG: hypothetical protein V7788_15720 [Alphaproteobacteria bacterium]